MGRIGQRRPHGTKRTVAAAGLGQVILVWLAVAAASSETVAAGQNPAGSQGTTFKEAVDVVVANVEVLVTDRNGDPVEGIPPSDFELRLGGTVVPIQFFTEVRAGRSVPTNAETAEAATADPALVGAQRGTSYLIFIDDYFCIKSQRDVVLRGLQEQAWELGKADRMAIVAYDGRHIDTLTPWTSQGEDLDDAFEKAASRPSRGIERRAELLRFDNERADREFLKRLIREEQGEALPRTARDTALEPEARDFALRLADQIQASATAAATAMRALEDTGGRRVLLLLTGNWPFSIADYVAPDPSRLATDADIPSGEDLYGVLVDSANLVGFTVFPVDVPGVTTNPGGTLLNEPLIPFPAEGDASPSRFGLTMREGEAEHALGFVAAETGGEAILNSGRLDALTRAAASTRSYYWLGFEVGRQYGGQRHEIAVKVARKGLRLRFRRSLTDLTREVERALALERVALLGPDAGARRLEVELGAPVNTGRKMMSLPLTISVPADQVTFLESNSAWVAKLELVMASVDQKGYRSDVERTPFRITLPFEPIAGSLWREEISFELRRIEQEIGLALVDLTSGEMWLRRLAVSP